jgi:hypothetical protein
MGAKRNDSIGTRVLRWIARILSIPPVIFFFLFLIGHLVGEERSTVPITPVEVIGLVSLVAFTSLMVIALIVAWKWEKIGSFVVVISSVILFTILLIVVGRNNFYVASIIVLPFFIPGLLFLGTWLRSRRA